MLNDIAAAPGLSVTFFTQGCPHRCKGCHNPQTWDYDGGMEFTPDVFDQIRAGLTAQGIQRNFCVNTPLLVGALKLLHEVDQSLNTLNRHGVVDAGTAAADQTVTFELGQTGSGGFGDELGIQFIVGSAENNVHP